MYLWLIHVDTWQKPAQYCKAVILQLKINVFFEESFKIKVCAFFFPIGIMLTPSVQTTLV